MKDPQTKALNFQLSAFKFQLSELTLGHFFPLNVARTRRTTSVTKMKSMRNLAMGIKRGAGSVEQGAGQATGKTGELI